jgi:hypothetical protein
MSQRILFGFITVFWLVMNVLLWRAEHFGAKVPAETVWKRLLSPEEDISHYDIYRVGGGEELIGSFTWTSTVLDQNGSAMPLENMTRQPAGYSIEIDATPPETMGSITLSNGRQLEFRLDLQFDVEHEWKSMALVVYPPAVRPDGGGPARSEWRLSLVSSVTNDVVEIGLERERGNFKAMEINPSRDGLVGTAGVLLKQLGGETLLGNDQSFGILSRSAEVQKMLRLATQPGTSVLPHRRFQLPWEAHYGTLPNHSHTLRVYRMSTPLEVGVMNFGEIIAYIGQNGELLRAQLPLAGGIEIRSRRHYPLPTTAR